MEIWRENEMIRSALDCDLKKLDKCLSEGHDINIQTEKGINLLMLSICFAVGCAPKTEYIKSLITNGIDLNHANDFKQTALHVASYSNNVEVVKLLVEAGIDINAIDEKGLNALMYACKDIPLFSPHAYEKWDVPEELKEYRRMIWNETYCMREYEKTRKEYQLEIVKYLVEHNIDLEQKNAQGKTALDLAIENIYISSPEMVKVLHEAGVVCNNLKEMNMNFFETLFEGGPQAFIATSRDQHNYNRKIKSLRRR